MSNADQLIRLKIRSNQHTGRSLSRALARGVAARKRPRMCVFVRNASLTCFQLVFGSFLRLFLLGPQLFLLLPLLLVVFGVNVIMQRMPSIV